MLEAESFHSAPSLVSTFRFAPTGVSISAKFRTSFLLGQSLTSSFPFSSIGVSILPQFSCTSPKYFSGLFFNNPHDRLIAFSSMQWNLLIAHCIYVKSKVYTLWFPQSGNFFHFVTLHVIACVVYFPLLSASPILQRMANFLVCRDPQTSFSLSYKWTLQGLSLLQPFWANR